MTDTCAPHPCSTDSGHLCMPEDARKRARHRLSIARGHIESIVKMLEKDDVYCVDVLRQIKAVQGALSGAGDVVLRGHLEAHVATAAERGDTVEIVEELMEALRYR
ncbi:DNA-binding transcriptional regulator, FrmR family [Deinococcus reticulitermitis]|uniref:Copper-sensing transcriptional repressor CsoR n=1 Tax=Deinococcus reticulitermitis TaxID=856736 RepID=A0A1H6YIC9_9DEIO|nr:metal-sensitive transcriptional regulator [Deinococcus reticulitermitis]SEJ41039.1 DNA-binding transcriptional regulator, FrmR family [Deinococcus reticulitermitis]